MDSGVRRGFDREAGCSAPQRTVTSIDHCRQLYANQGMDSACPADANQASIGSNDLDMTADTFDDALDGE